MGGWGYLHFVVVVILLHIIRGLPILLLLLVPVEGDSTTQLLWRRKGWVGGWVKE